MNFETLTYIDTWKAERFHRAKFIHVVRNYEISFFDSCQ